MTDLATIRIPVDSSDMVKAVREAKNLEGGVNLLFNALKSGSISSTQFNKGLDNLTKQFKNLFRDSEQASGAIQAFANSVVASSKEIEQAAEMRNWFSAQRRRIAMMEESERIAKRQADEETKAAERIAAAQEKATQAILKQRAAAAQAASAKASDFQAGIGPNLGLGAQGISAAASASAFEQEIEKLRQKYDKVYVASQLYEQQLNEIVQAERLGILSKQQYQNQLDALNMEYEQFANSAENAYIANNRFSQHVNATGRGLNNFGFVAQQVGYQVGDFFVQVQSGTNVLVAFGQQATQLAGLIPGIWGAAIGIGISLVTALGSALMKASEAADGSKKALEEYQGVLESLNSSISDTSLSLEALRRGVEPDKILEANLAIQDLTSTLDTLHNTPIEGFMDAFTRADRMIAAQALKQELEKTLEVLKKQQEEEQRLETAAKRRANEVRDYYREQEKAKQAHADQVKLMGDQLAAQGRMKTAAEAVLEKYGMMRTVAAGVANELSRAADESFRMAQQSLAASGLTYSGRGGDPRKSNQQGYGEFVYTGPALDENNNVIPENTGGGGSTEKQDPLEKLKEQLALENELIGKTEAQKRVFQALGEDRSKYSQKEIDAITAEIEAYNTKMQVMEQQKRIMDTVKSSLEDGFMSMVEGTKSVKDAFKDMARDIIKELYRVFVVQRMVGAIAGAVNMFSLPSATPATGTLGLPDFRASGGSIMPGKPYIVGERGPELVIPRHAGTVMNANQTASTLGGNGAGNVTVQNNITVTGSDAAMVRAEVAKMIPQITNATKAAVIDAKQRGGQMAAAFR